MAGRLPAQRGGDERVGSARTNRSRGGDVGDGIYPTIELCVAAKELTGYEWLFLINIMENTRVQVRIVRCLRVFAVYCGLLL